MKISWHDSCLYAFAFTKAMQELILANSVLKAQVDDDVFERASKYRWYLHTTGTVARNYKKAYKTHHVALSNEVFQKFDGSMFDHIDRNKLNNQRNNLRECSHAQNCANKSKQNKKTTSKYKGVSFYKRTGKWQAYIKHNYAQKNLGHFLSEEDAAKAYNNAAVKLFGEFAHLNKI